MLKGLRWWWLNTNVSKLRLTKILTLFFGPGFIPSHVGYTWSLVFKEWTLDPARNVFYKAITTVAHSVHQGGRFLTHSIEEEGIYLFSLLLHEHKAFPDRLNAIPLRRVISTEAYEPIRAGSACFSGMRSCPTILPHRLWRLTYPSENALVWT